MPAQSARRRPCVDTVGIGMMQGYVQAVAEIIRLHDEPSLAKEVLRAFGGITWKHIDEYDLETLVRAGLVPKRRLADARRRSAAETRSPAPRE